MKLFITKLCLCTVLLVSSISAREVTNFNDGWSFKKGPFPENMKLTAPELAGGWTDVKIPHTWNADDMQLNKNDFYQGPGYYKKTYTPDPSLKGKRVYLRFEGVASYSEVYINKNLAGNHKGAYSAFAIEISSLLKYGEENEIVVLADNKARPDIIPINHKLFGVYGGMYRPVQLIITDTMNISVLDFASPGIYLKQQNVTSESADVQIKVKMENKTDISRQAVLSTSIYENDGSLKIKDERNIIVLPQGRQTFFQEVKVNAPHLWQGLDDPYLYKVVTQVIENGKVIDEVTQNLGLRHFELKPTEGMYLNGKKVPMYGTCRHQEWLGLGSALTEENHDTDLAIIKEMGATTIRFAHYQQSDYLYTQCDKIGFIIWAEIPFVNRVSTQEAENSKQQMVELIRQNYNHPSIYTWGLHNEVYKPHEYTTQLTMDLNDIAKSEDPDRYTVSVNGYGDMKHPVNLNADIQGMNRYFGWYESSVPKLEDWIAGLQKNFPNYLTILAEYGAEANIDQHDEDVGDKGNFYSDHQFYPEEFATRFHEIQWGIISKQNYLAATYIWNTFDFATPETTQGGVNSRNMKGLVTFDRKVKKDDFYWYKANWSKEPVVYLTQRRATERTNKVTPVTVYSNIGAPVIIVNGKQVKSYQQGTTPVHYIFEDITLQEGKNTINAKVISDGKTYEDSIVWNYNPSNEGKSRTKLRNKETKTSEKEHSGL